VNRMSILSLVLVAGIATAGEAEQPPREPLPTSLPELTTETCTTRVPKWQAEFQHLEKDMHTAKSAFAAAPTPERETTVVAAVDAFVNAIHLLAAVEHRCTELVAESARGA